MSQTKEINMSPLKRLWTRIVSIAQSFDDIDDPVGDYIQSLGKRLDKLERHVEKLEGQWQSRTGGGMQ